MLKYLGSLSVGAINIGVGLTLPILTDALLQFSTLKAQLLQQITTNLELQVTIIDPLALLAQAEAAIKQMLATLASLLPNAKPVLIKAGVEFGVQLSAVVGFVLAINALMATLLGAMSAGGVHAYSIEANVGAVSGELGAQINAGLPGGAGPNGKANALVLITESPAAWTALSTLIKTS